MHRRTCLRAVGAGAVGLAGCLSGGDPDAEREPEGPDTERETGGSDATRETEDPDPTRETEGPLHHRLRIENRSGSERRFSVTLSELSDDGEPTETVLEETYAVEHRETASLDEHVSSSINYEVRIAVADGVTEVYHLYNYMELTVHIDSPNELETSASEA